MEDAYGSTSRPTGLRSAKPVVPISDSPDSSCAHDHRCCCRLQVQKSWRPTPKQKRQDFHARSNSLRFRINRLLVHCQRRDSRYGCCASDALSTVCLGGRPLEDEEKISPPEAGSGHCKDRVIEPVPNVGSTLEVAMNHRRGSRHRSRVGRMGPEHGNRFITPPTRPCPSCAHSPQKPTNERAHLLQMPRQQRAS